MCGCLAGAAAHACAEPVKIWRVRQNNQFRNCFTVQCSSTRKCEDTELETRMTRLPQALAVQ